MSSSPGSSLSSSPKSSFSESSDGFSDERRDSYERVYTKDFLLSLRKCPSALVKPDHLPDLPQIICDEVSFNSYLQTITHSVSLPQPCMNRKRTDSCSTSSYRSNENQNFNRFPNHFRGRRRVCF